MRQQVNGWAEAATPDVSGSIAVGGDIEFPTVSVQVDVDTTPFALGFFEQRDALALFAWLDKEKLVSKLDALLDAEKDDGIALTDTDCQKQEATILSDLLANDRDECALVELAATQNIIVEHRADVSPLASRLGPEPPPRRYPVYGVGASSLVGAAACSAGDTAACSAGGWSATGSAGCGAACCSVAAGASGSAAGCSVPLLPSSAVIVTSVCWRRGFRRFLLQHECCENLGWVQYLRLEKRSVCPTPDARGENI